MEAVLAKYNGEKKFLDVYTKDEQKDQVKRYLEILKRFTKTQTVEAVGDFLLKKEKDDEYLESQVRKESQFKWIFEQTFDFFGLQEFDKKEIKDDDGNITAVKGMKGAYAKAYAAYAASKKESDADYGIILGPQKKLDVAILYNKSWIPVCVADDPTKYDTNYFAAGVAQDFVKDQRRVTVVCAHLKSGKNEKDRKTRKEQAQEIMDHIATKTNVIICVDANDTEGEMLFTNPEQVNGDDDAISITDAPAPCIPNYDPKNLIEPGTWTSDHYALCATLGTSDDTSKTLTKVESETRDKKGKKTKKNKKPYASTTKRRGASSEQLKKIGEWVSGTIDFILAKGDVTGIIAWSWNLLNRADGFFLPGDTLKEKDTKQQGLIDEFIGVEEAAEEKKKKKLLKKEMQALSLDQKKQRLIEKIGQKKYDKLLKKLEQNELDKELAKKLVEIEFKRDGEYYHWEQEVIRLAHFYAKQFPKMAREIKLKLEQEQKTYEAKLKKAEAKAERTRKVRADILKRAKIGEERRKASDLRAKAATKKTTQGILQFGKGIRNGFTLRF